MATRMTQQFPAEQTTRPTGRGTCSSPPFSMFSSATSTTAPSSPMSTSSTNARCATSASTATSCMPRPGSVPASRTPETRAQGQPGQLDTRKRPARWRAFRFSAAGGPRSVLDLRRQLAAIGSELARHLLVQPDIHAGRVVGVTAVAELLGEFLAGRQARIDIERLHQVDDRGAPFQLLVLGFRGLVDDRGHIDVLRRSTRGRRSRRWRAATRGGAAAGWRGLGRMAENRAHDLSENAHQWLLMDGDRMKNSAGGVPLRAARQSLCQPPSPANPNTATNMELTEGGMTAE